MAEIKTKVNTASVPKFLDTKDIRDLGLMDEYARKDK